MKTHLEGPRIITELPGPKARQLLARDEACISPSYTRAYPLVVDRGYGAIVEDVDGNRFLDFNAGIAVCATGHCHPEVVDAIQRQSQRLIHMSGTDFYYAPMIELAEELCRIAPGNFAKKVYFGNSGTEAIEAALKLARHSTGRDKFIAFYNSFHGRTLGALSLTASKAVQRRGFSPLMPGVFHIPYANCYRCIYRLEHPACETYCVAEILPNLLFRTAVPPEEVAAIVVEPVQGEGGYVVPPRSFLEELRRIADRYGILIIADEVQCGMGRTGKMWASEHFDFVPDIIAVAKGIASGLPLGAVIARAELMKWGHGAHASTFGGNPVSCAAALATIRLLKEQYIDNCAAVGSYLRERLGRLKDKYHVIGDVRGLGLMIGIEIVAGPLSRRPDPQLRDRIVRECFKRGLLILGCGESALRLSPPLVISREQADIAVEILDETLAAISSEAAAGGEKVS